MKSVFFLTTILILSSCSSKKVRTEDLESWRGEPISSLDRHPVFSALPREEREISGTPDKLINFSQKRIVETGNRNCIGTGIGFGGIGLGANNCSRSEVEERACVHQFLVKNNIIDSYRVLGDNCYTECKFRPRGPCK